MNNQKVSIVIPTFNRAEYLKECINSCLQQTVECEIIVCDHGSTDNTPSVAKEYGERIKYVRRELDSGVHFCWLDGIHHATNELIHLNFDDDWIENTFIEKCVQLFTPEVGCVFSNAKIYFEEEKTYQNSIFFPKLNSGIHPSGILIRENIKSLTSPCAGIFRKEVLLDTLFQGKVPFSKNEYRGVGPDILFSLFSGLRFKQFGFVNEDLAVFRAHNNSITIDALKNSEKQAKIEIAYDDSRIYYYINKLVEKLHLYTLASKILQKRKTK